MYRPFPRRHRQHRRWYIREQLFWPLPDIRGYRPVIVAIDKATFDATLAYRDAPLDGPLAPPILDVQADGSAGHYCMPEYTPVLAMRSGVVIAASVDDGITIDHRNGSCTTYVGPFETLIRAKRAVNGGEVIGTLRSPASAPWPLRFELRRYQWDGELLPGHPRLSLTVNPLSALLGTMSIPIEGLRKPTWKEAA